jgi:DNA polymerase-3 subunit chi
MTDVWFYHLQRSSLAEALPSLVEKCLQRGWRVLVTSSDAERLDELDQALWTYADESFLPHGLDGRDPPERQPILLSADAAPKNRAKAHILLDGASIDRAHGFERVIVLFDGTDDAAIRSARVQWSAAKEAGDTVSYWQEIERGKWEKRG